MCVRESVRVYVCERDVGTGYNQLLIVYSQGRETNFKISYMSDISAPRMGINIVSPTLGN